MSNSVDKSQSTEASCFDEKQHRQWRLKLHLHQRAEISGLEQSSFPPFLRWRMPRKVDEYFAKGWSQYNNTICQSCHRESGSVTFSLSYEHLGVLCTGVLSFSVLDFRFDAVSSSNLCHLTISFQVNNIVIKNWWTDVEFTFKKRPIISISLAYHLCQSWPDAQDENPHGAHCRSRRCHFLSLRKQEGKRFTQVVNTEMDVWIYNTLRRLLAGAVHWLHMFMCAFCFGLLQIHPDVPKRPPPANAMFMEENWAKFRKTHPKMPTKELLTLIHQNYKKLPDKEKVSSEKGWFKKGATS